MPENGKTSQFNGRSVFRTMLIPLLVLILAETLLLAGSLWISGVSNRLDQNSRDIMGKQTQNREGYLENYMVGRWSDLTLLAESINIRTQELLNAGTLSLEELDSSSDVCAPLILDITDELISTLYSKAVSGVFVVFNTADLDLSRQSGELRNKAGIYIRDMDPSSSPSSRMADLLLERAPIAVVNGMTISTDAGWYPLFNFSEKQDYYDFLYYPYQAAIRAENKSSASDYGYWTKTPFTLQGDNLTAISYSIPLILPDGTVYGVVGIELLTDYLCTLLPYEELFDNECGSYILAVTESAPDEDGTYHFSPVLSHGAVVQQSGLADSLDLSENGDGGYDFVLDGKTYYADMQFLTLYSSNAPFDNQKWALIGVVQTQDLYAFSQQVRMILTLAILLNLAAGVIGTIIISRRLSGPIRKLSEEVDRAELGSDGIPQLSETGIREIDLFSNAITTLSRDVVNASTRFLRIMEMASVAIGGFELREEEDSVFVTDNFFPLFGIEDVRAEGLTKERFQALFEQLNRSKAHVQAADGSVLYEVRLPQGDLRYVHVEVSSVGDRSFGLAEDVTQATLERKRIEHERDYDLLTGLLNRRAFYRLTEKLFESPDKLGHAALVMLDLDNLKMTNDRFGHDWGDQYIRQAGQCFVRNVPAQALCARVSGDEFYIFLYGSESREIIRDALENLSQAIRSSSFALPNGEVSSIRVSGGVAWYPEDSRNFGELMRYADFAMYQVKQTHKGQFGDFDLGIYNRESFVAQSKRELIQLLDDGLLNYHFQPIIDAATGQTGAYEALMRVDMPTIRTPDTMLKLAREEGRLHEVERLTWYKAAERYQMLLKKGLVQPEAFLFINSIASQCMDQEEQTGFLQRYAPLRDRIVVEITEAEDMDREKTQMKRKFPGFSGMFALDDYGSGYNSEKNLLELAPKFIKVDISIVRDIDSDTDKQQIVSNIVEYAHARGMYIIAEGLETAGELRKVLELGVDLLQGFFLARPAAVPGHVSQAALEIIHEHHRAAAVL